MSDRHASDATGHDDPTDLDWLADRFVLGELSADDEQTVVARLADDDQLAAAVARSSRLLVALQETQATSLRPAARGASRARLAIAVGAMAAALLVACWPALAPRFGPRIDDDGPREVVRIWRHVNEAMVTTDEPLPEAEIVEADTVPEWMLAAVGLDVTPAVKSRVQEN